MTKELAAFLRDCKNDLTSNDFTGVINKCPKDLHPELLNILYKQGIQLPILTDTTPLDENQWVAFWPKGRFASLTPSAISVIQLKDLPDFEEAAYSVVLQGDTGPTRIQRYVGSFYKEEELRKSTLYNSQEITRKNYQKEIDKEVVKLLDPFKELIQEYFPDVIFKTTKYRNSIYLQAYINPNNESGLPLLQVGTMTRTINNNLYNIQLYRISKQLNTRTEEMQFYFSPLDIEEYKSKEEIITYITNHCKEVANLINSK